MIEFLMRERERERERDSCSSLLIYRNLSFACIQSSEMIIMFPAYLVTEELREMVFNEIVLLFYDDIV